MFLIFKNISFIFYCLLYSLYVIFVFICKNKCALNSIGDINFFFYIEFLLRFNIFVLIVIFNFRIPHLDFCE